MTSPHYLVPMGRETGGYLDTLGLPADATPQTVATKDVEYRRALQTELKKQCRALVEKRKEGAITTEECDAQVKALQDASSQRLSELNKLHASYDARRAQKRGQASAGRRKREEAPSWAPLFPAVSAPDGGWHRFLVRRRPPPRVADERIDELRRRWVDPLFALRRHPAPAAPPAPRGARGRTAYLAALAQERDLVHLLVVDALWSRLKGTVREPWCERISQWRAEAEKLGPRLASKAVRPLPKADAHDPYGLAAPRDLGVRKLEPGESLEERRSREAAQKKKPDEEMLKELLAALERGDVELSDPVADEDAS